ncbi:MAG TPA: neutral zinc metallopeptidase [Chitinophagaceae bacterium]|nr:neutral zinc metallopeptidase [Chitinophagaceae bacterium]
MLWKGRRESTNVDDRRGVSTGGMVAGGGILGAIAMVIYFFLGGGDPSQLPQQFPANQPTELSPQEQAADDERARFVKVVLADTEDVWNQIFAQQGEDYPEPVLTLFRGGVQSGCGGATSQTGPFYCPADQRLYIDLSFYQELQDRFNAPGDFAMAYVVAHEVGHHIQTVNGTSQKMEQLRQQLSEAEYNKYSVMMELQADFLAGVWAHYAQRMKLLEEGDIQEALNAAQAIGDDRLQKQSQGYAVPESFTHGTSAQRMYWFKKGYTTGDIRQGDTFNDPSLR